MSDEVDLRPLLDQLRHGVLAPLGGKVDVWHADPDPFPLVVDDDSSVYVSLTLGESPPRAESLRWRWPVAWLDIDGRGHVRVDPLTGEVCPDDAAKLAGVTADLTIPWLTWWECEGGHGAIERPSREDDLAWCDVCGDSPGPWNDLDSRRCEDCGRFLSRVPACPVCSEPMHERSERADRVPAAMVEDMVKDP